MDHGTLLVDCCVVKYWPNIGVRGDGQTVSKRGYDESWRRMWVENDARLWWDAIVCGLFFGPIGALCSYQC